MKKQKFDLLSFEKNLWEKGIRHIVGCDEVGRGSLAGPLVVCAVVLDLEKVFSETFDPLYLEINDSKRLSANKRELLNKFLLSEVKEYSISEISNRDIDKKGLIWALQKAYSTSINNISIKEHILTDHIFIRGLNIAQTNIIKGDSKSISIASASIIAKVYRDKLMTKLSKKYQEYGFEKNKGYGTKYHLKKIQESGFSNIHRKSFRVM